ncbi:hypothetical protein BD0115_09680 [Helicobacter pylori]
MGILQKKFKLNPVWLFGADANRIKLKEISSKVFDSAEIFQVLHFMKKVDAIKQ